MSKPKRIPPVTDEFWENEILDKTRDIIEEFITQQQLSDRTLKQYQSATRIFARWVHENVRPKGEALITDLRPRHARQYQDWLISMGLSNNTVKFRRSVVSSLCGFIELYYDDEYPDFRNIYSKSIPSVPKTNAKEKDPLTSKEVNKIAKQLKKEKDWQKLAWFLFTYSTGCRREESRQLLAEVADYDFFVDKKGNVKNYYRTHQIRAKGAGKDGNVRRFTFDEDTMWAIKKWLEYRKDQVSEDDCEYVFVSKRKGKYKQITANTFNLWCDKFGKIIGKDVHPHLIRTSRATISVVEEGKDIKKVQSLLGHQSSQTTEIYVVRDDEDDLDDLY